MPIYEFYCPDCHTVFSFLAAAADTTRRPPCPRCERPRLTRQLSRFAVPKHAGETAPGGDEGAADEALGGLDEGRMEQAMAALASEAEHLDESDPKQAVHMMRKLSQMTGLRMGDGMEEALRRIEAGEDPEAVEAEMGDLLEGEDPFQGPAGTGAGGARATRTRRAPPARDDKLYRL